MKKHRVLTTPEYIYTEKERLAIIQAFKILINAIGLGKKEYSHYQAAIIKAEVIKNINRICPEISRYLYTSSKDEHGREIFENKVSFVNAF